MNELQFYFEDNDVRTITENEEIWFVLADVCKALGLTNPTKVASRLDEDEKAKPNSELGLPGQTAWFINEAGLYHVILSSESEKAKPFRRWITHEVIPAIRKQGFYSMLTEEKLLEVLQERTDKDINYLSFIDKAQMKKSALAKQRAERDELTARLWDERFKEGKYTEDAEFWNELRRIWVGDMTMCHKYRDRYRSDVNKVERGREVVFRSFLKKSGR